MLFLLLAVSFQYEMRGAISYLHIIASSSVRTKCPKQYLTVLERLQHVARQAETLQATTTKLKDDACKAPLLTKISQSFSRDGPREVNSPSSSRKQPAVSGGATRAASPTTEE